MHGIASSTPEKVSLMLPVDSVTDVAGCYSGLKSAPWTSQELRLALTSAPGSFLIHRLIAVARTAGIGNSVVSPFW
jgi:hypothetical protein